MNATLDADPRAGTTSAATSAGTGRNTLFRTIRSEFIKLTTLRSTWWMVGGLLTLLVLVGLISAATSTGSLESPDSDGGGGFGASDPVSTVLAGANIAVLLVAVLGVLIGAREYTSGSIGLTLTAVPQRRRIVLGKLVAAAGLLIPTALIGVLVAFFAGMAILDGSDAVTVGFGDDGVARAVLGNAAYLVGIGLLGVALGVLLRSTAGGIGALIGGVLFLPTLAGVLLPDSWDEVLSYLPSNAGAAFTSLMPTPDLLSATNGALVFSAWVFAAIVGSAVALHRRDI